MKYYLAAIAAASLVATGAAFAPNMGGTFRKDTNLRMSAEADFVNAEIAANDVVVFSKSYCPFCKKTKSTLESMNIDAKVYELNQMDNGAAIQDALLELSGQKTVPNVFVKGEHLGGNDDTQAAAKDGKLASMLGL
mmetsp:Transcript_12986/g.17850  ORF Transcript_12986/g.17850 Transcript_12986/m.17850 type:complete len:136 (-) Transcript_12986:340-747(-)|eukprot:CAMPEP_0185728662 /NCGR_PEP_ID=MMETSP1171-20130828/4017_1 /TAXON_ID=374046 /ORGANISM="Helicotheca tamensis, Strain CCMP826" /LENGTH=135 /DNA_ID=CAMNT_0028397391 /DNA_START=60 /DNA_END=467 /DNA_ORIENTATION=-